MHLIVLYLYYGRTERYSDIIHADNSQGYMHASNSLYSVVLYFYYGRTEGYSDIIHADSSQGYMHLIHYSFIYTVYIMAELEDIQT